MKKFLITISFPYKFYLFHPYYTHFFSHTNKTNIHLFYNFFCVLKNYLKVKNIKSSKKIAFFFKNGFLKINKYDDEPVMRLISLLNHDFKNSKNERKLDLSHYSNYTVDDNFRNDSQYFLNLIPQTYCDNIFESIKKNKELDLIIKKYFKSFYKIVNIRCWKYFSNKNNKLKTEVGPHYDGFPHKTLKIMFYKDFFFRENPALEFLDDVDESRIYCIKGLNPFTLFDSNHLYHRAKFPLKDRDAIEITLQPSFYESTIPISAGFSSGYKINPFKKSIKLN